MFVHMTFVRKADHSARGENYEILVYRVQETNEYRIYVAKNRFGVGVDFVASDKVVVDSGGSAIDELINTAKGDIDRNEFGLYGS